MQEGCTCNYLTIHTMMVEDIVVYGLEDEMVFMYGLRSYIQSHFFLFFFIFFYGNRFMQQQRSQEDSYIHKRLIANINLGPCTKTKSTTQ